MSFTLRPAVRENTPLIVGLAGPTKSGKTMSALRLAAGMTPQRDKIVMLNAEGKRGKQYADWYEARYGAKYLNMDIESPFSPERYTEALLEIAKAKPPLVIIDSCSHMHDGPGGLIEYHNAEVERIAGKDPKKQERVAMAAAWVRPKMAENQCVYTMLDMDIPFILCFRAKEKMKYITGKPPVELGWQPIAGDRIAFETIFTVVLPPHSKGVPDLSLSEMREPFDAMIKPGEPIDEALGGRLAAWSAGGQTAQQQTAVQPQQPSNGTITINQKQAQQLLARFTESLRADIQAQALPLLLDFVRSQGSEALLAIPSTTFPAVGKAAVAHAKQL